MRVLPALLATAVHGLSTKNPILEVVQLLERIHDENVLEEAKDVKHMKAWSCHFKDTEKQLTDDIKDSEDKIGAANGIIEATTKDITSKGTTKKAKQAELQKVGADLKTANTDEVTRMAEFNKRSTELTQAISALKGAVTTLKKHQSFLQSSANMKKFAKTLSKAVSMYKKAMRPSQMQSLQAFLQQPTVAKYQSQSGQIFGLLSQMQEDFEQDLAEAQKADENAKEAHADLAENSATRQQTLTETIALKDQEISKAKADQAENQVIKSQHEDKLRINNESLTALRATNTEKRNARDLRKAARDEEQTAVQNAIKILRDSKGRQNAQETFGMFLQVSIKPHLALTQEQKAAGTFQTIIDKIDERIGAIKREKDNDREMHAKCVKDIADNKEKIGIYTVDKTTAEQQIEALDAQIKDKTAQKEKNTEEINTNTESMNGLTADRESENGDYKKAHLAHKQTAVVLTDAIKALAVFAPKALIQQAPTEGESQSDAQNAGGSKAITLLQKIRGEVKAQMLAMVTDENASQKSYETAIQGINMLNDNLNKENSELGQVIGTMGTQKANLESIDLAGAVKNLNSEKKTLADNENSCAFILNHLNAKLDHADNEIQAMKSAKQFLESSSAELSASEGQVDDSAAEAREG